LQSGKGFPKSLWWKIGATFLISFFVGGGGGAEMFDILQYFLREMYENLFSSKI
jgi:hypothetical protein